MTKFKPSRELDALVAEKVMRLSLIPDRITAMINVGARHTHGSDGKGQLQIDDAWVSVPNAAHIKYPEKFQNIDDINDRYWWWVANYLGEKVETEVRAERTTPKPYSTDIRAAWEVVEKITLDKTSPKQFFIGTVVLQDCRSGYRACFIGPATSVLTGTVEIDSAPLAICLAALKAVEEK